MMQMRSMIKTSHNIGKFLKSALKRDQIDEGAMADDLGVTRPSIANHTGKYNAPIDMAAKYSTYLHDSKFNQQMAAVYFDAISMFDPSKWAKQFQNAPYATWFQLREIEKKRIAMGEDVFAFAVNDHHKWTAEQKHLAHDWMINLLKTISLSTFMAKQFSEVADYDMVDWSKQFNQEFGGVKYE
ncbi:hypothetical protein AB3X83_04790 [Lentilactobacillus buchneri]|uniref:hypothetical protein n=1 Tax=Lentilactobacillus buchneri TaxID=1581 RepID=UPI0034E382CB